MMICQFNLTDLSDEDLSQVLEDLRCAQEEVLAEIKHRESGEDEMLLVIQRN